MRSKTFGLGFFLLVAIALAMLVFSAFYPLKTQEVRGNLENWAAPGLSGAVTLLAPLRSLARKFSRLSTGDEDLQRLRRENQELRGWQWRAAELERKLKDLQALAKVVRKPGVGFVTSQILSVSPGPGVHSILVNVGSKHGVKVGNAVINGDGLVGIVDQVSVSTARVRLLDDTEAGVDVIVGRDGVLAHMNGVLSGLGRLSFHDSEAVVRRGDKVMTSGNLNGVPRGLKVGMLVREKNGLRVTPYAALGRLEFVSVLLGAKGGSGSPARLMQPTTGSLGVKTP